MDQRGDFARRLYTAGAYASWKFGLSRRARRFAFDQSISVKKNTAGQTRRHRPCVYEFVRSGVESTRRARGKFDDRGYQKATTAPIQTTGGRIVRYATMQIDRKSATNFRARRSSYLPPSLSPACLRQLFLICTVKYFHGKSPGRICRMSGRRENLGTLPAFPLPFERNKVFWPCSSGEQFPWFVFPPFPSSPPRRSDLHLLGGSNSRANSRSPL